MIKHVLVDVDATTAGKSCLNYAIALAGHLDAKLTGIHIQPPAEVAPLYKPSQIGPALALIEDRARTNAAAAARWFGELTGNTNLQCDWKCLSGDMADEINKAARFADLTVLSQHKWPSPPLRQPLSLAEVTLMKCAGPILIVPDQIEPSIPARALILWDGSRETARALHDAIPLIRGCSTSLEIECCEGADFADLEPLVEHLARHAIAVFRPGATTSESSMIEQWHEGGFDLLIMGAFGRAPWRELLFGGPTLTATRMTRVPLLASH